MSKKILFIDDEKDLTDLAGLYLRSHGIDAHGCNDPAQALSRMQQERFDIVFVDLMMFPMDGITLLRELRQDPYYTHIPLFVLSAKILSNEERKELMTLRIRFLAKPIHPRDLLKKIQEKVPS